MNIIEMHERIHEIYKQYADTIDNDWNGEYEFIGIRFEDKERSVGEIITDNSRNNVDRDDEREFPEFGTEEYEEMEELDGISAWYYEQYNFRVSKLTNVDSDCRTHFNAKHCYILGANDLGEADIVDDGEIIMQDAVVLEKIF